MSGEEMERAIDFLLKSQANLEQRIEQVNSNLGARIAETNAILGEYARMQTQLIETVTRTFDAQVEINRRTDERLHALMSAVERHVSEGHGGKKD
jgi:deoxyribodipyrimidine photolyase